MPTKPLYPEVVVSMLNENGNSYAIISRVHRSIMIAYGRNKQKVTDVKYEFNERIHHRDRDNLITTIMQMFTIAIPHPAPNDYDDPDDPDDIDIEEDE